MNMPAKSIVVAIKTQSGTEVVVPVCVNAQTFADIANAKTLSKDTIKHIQKLGYAINIKQEVKTLANIFATA